MYSNTNYYIVLVNKKNFIVLLIFCLFKNLKYFQDLEALPKFPVYIPIICLFFFLKILQCNLEYYFLTFCFFHIYLANYTILQTFFSMYLLKLWEGFRFYANLI